VGQIQERVKQKERDKCKITKGKKTAGKNDSPRERGREGRKERGSPGFCHRQAELIHWSD
jgi:hypothetical protein